jgi:hypothetical protein
LDGNENKVKLLDPKKRTLPLLAELLPHLSDWLAAVDAKKDEINEMLAFALDQDPGSGLVSTDVLAWWGWCKERHSKLRRFADFNPTPDTTLKDSQRAWR